MIHSWLAPVASACALLVLAYLVWWLDRFHFDRLPHFLAAVALGAAAGVMIPGFALLSSLAGPRAWLAMPAPNGGWAEHLGAIARGTVVAAVVIAAVLLAVERRAGVDTPVDGAIFGIAAGCGFALANGAAARMIEGSAEPGILVGAILEWAAVGALLGIGVRWALAAVRGVRVLLRVALALAGACALAVVLASFARALQLTWATVAAGVVALGGAFAFAVWDERRVALRQLREESALGVVPEELVATAASYRRRIRRAWWPHPEERRAILQLLLALAFRKHQLIGLGPDQVQLYGLEVGRLRQRLRRVFQHEERVV